MKLPTFFIIMAAAIFYSINALADHIILEDGTIIKGKIDRVTRGVIIYTPYDSTEEIEISRELVRIVIYEDENANENQESTDSNPEKDESKYKKQPVKKDYKMNYPVLGITLPGTPAGINLVFGYYSRWVCIHFSGGYLGYRLYGAQANLLFSFYHSRNAIHGLALVGGFMHIKPSDNRKKWYYGGLAYNMNIRGFFLEVGLTGGWGDYPNPQFIAQIGYVHRFNKI